MVADPGAREVHDGLGALKPGEVDGAGLWVPRDLVGGCARPAHEAHDLVTLRAQMGDEGGADEPGRAGDRNLHGPSIPHPAADARAAPELLTRGACLVHPAPCLSSATRPDRAPTRCSLKPAELPPSVQLVEFRGADSPEPSRFARCMAMTSRGGSGGGHCVGTAKSPSDHGTRERVVRRAFSSRGTRDEDEVTPALVQRASSRAGAEGFASEAELGVERRSFEPVLHRPEETCRIGTVDEPVVV